MKYIISYVVGFLFGMAACWTSFLPHTEYIESCTLEKSMITYCEGYSDGYFDGGSTTPKKQATFCE